jgi:hypothetical protein
MLDCPFKREWLIETDGANATTEFILRPCRTIGEVFLMLFRHLTLVGIQQSATDKSHFSVPMATEKQHHPHQTKRHTVPQALAPGPAAQSGVVQRFGSLLKRVVQVLVKGLGKPRIGGHHVGLAGQQQAQRVQVA